MNIQLANCARTTTQAGSQRHNNPVQPELSSLSHELRDKSDLGQTESNAGTAL